MGKERLYKADELAGIMNVSIDTIWRWGREGKLERMKVGRTVRFAKPRKEQSDVQVHRLRQGI